MRICHLNWMNSLNSQIRIYSDLEKQNNSVLISNICISIIPFRSLLFLIRLSQFPLNKEQKFKSNYQNPFPVEFHSNPSNTSTMPNSNFIRIIRDVFNTIVSQIAFVFLWRCKQHTSIRQTELKMKRWWTNETGEADTWKALR